MRLSYTADEDSTLYLRIEPRDAAERSRIIDALNQLLYANDSLPATLYVEANDSTEIHAVTDDLDNRVLTLNGRQPSMIINVFEETK